MLGSNKYVNIQFTSGGFALKEDHNLVFKPITTNAKQSVLLFHKVSEIP
jgi:hypothetical protein